jgi:hypothetical protein
VISWFQSFGFQLQLASLHLGNPPTTARTALGWTTITSITFTNDGGFNTGACTSAGIFTAPVDGYYYAGASIRIDGAGSGYFRMIISINDGGTFSAGHAIMVAHIGLYVVVPPAPTIHHSYVANQTPGTKQTWFQSLLSHSTCTATPR